MMACTMQVEEEKKTNIMHPKPITRKKKCIHHHIIYACSSEGTPLDLKDNEHNI